MLKRTPPYHGIKGNLASLTSTLSHWPRSYLKLGSLESPAASILTLLRYEFPRSSLLPFLLFLFFSLTKTLSLLPVYRKTARNGKPKETMLLRRCFTRLTEAKMKLSLIWELNAEELWGISNIYI